MAVTVDPVQHLDRHAEEPGGLPFVHAGLHQPRRARVAQRVRRHVIAKAGELDRMAKRGSD